MVVSNFDLSKCFIVHFLPTGAENEHKKDITQIFFSYSSSF